MPERGSLTKRRPDRIICSHMYGRVEGTDVAKMHRDIIVMIAPNTPKVWLVNTVGVTSFDALGLPKPANMFLNDLKARGFMVVGIITNSAVRMMGRTLCFGAGIRHQFYETERDAEQGLAEVLKEGENR